jgi:hypothetical protein
MGIEGDPVGTLGDPMATLGELKSVSGVANPPVILEKKH